MVHISTDFSEYDNSSAHDVNYVNFNMKLMRNNLASSLEKFWQCVEVKAEDYMLKNSVNEINIQREEFISFLEGSIQQSHVIRGYSSKLQLFLNCFRENSLSIDEYHKELESLLNDTKTNLKSAEMLQAQVRKIKNELVKIGDDINSYQENIQHDPENVQSKSKDDFDKTKTKMKTSAFFRNVGILSGIVGLVAGNVALIIGGASTGIGSEISRKNYLSQSNDIRKQLVKESDELITYIDIVATNFESIKTAMGQLIGYWEIQSTTIYDLLDKLNSARNEQNFNNMLMRVIDKTIKDLESDELFSKDFCVSVRALMAKYELKCM
ncbi:12724_t:CDS:2 [Dentiscutata heterogama]|uniref:12724_t:CDS:1 n=1 Tax=Dentiscutata heterogama TaxID=1316150 RepID=A0ACA9K660_9GLOM|nr:12724_t:CDS:2 [Dentiscutata heterogama]